MKLQPLDDRIVVRPSESEETTASGLVIPDTAKEKPQQGEVLAVGPGRRTENTGLYGAWSVYAGTRSGLILTATILFGAVYGAGRRNPSLLVITGALAAIVVGVGFTTVSRGRFVGGSYNRELAVTDALDESLNWYKGSEGGDVVLGSEFGMSMAAVRYVGDEVPYDAGYMMLELFTRQIPPAICPDKNS